jgi:Tfp pilus assembly pilus retraction ATPase PilT
MRDPFAYENNALLMRQILVPDPLTRPAWEQLLTAWKAARQDTTLLEWIIGREYLTTAQLLRQMAEYAGIEIYREGPLEEIGPGADRTVLEASGFLVLGQRNGRGLVTGGPDFPPDLASYIGERAANWNWVLISPLRTDSPIKALHAYSPDKDPLPETSLESWINNLLAEAGIPGTADIHFERNGTKLTVRMRGREGMLNLAAIGPPRSMECMRYLKRLAGFSTADNPLPQDGRIRIAIGTRENVYRASHIRTVAGESLVLRTIGESEVVPRLEALGIPEELAARLRQATRQDSGLVLCTGATGSGKSTTLFSLLKELGPLPVKILSIEDPVELEIPDVIQSSVDTERGWTFPAALRAYLRQDPDIIFVGEIRDKASAEGAARAALTGHVVLSTLHASSCLAALDRLRAWDLPAGLIAETVSLVSHQRLVQSEGKARPEAKFSWMNGDAEAVYAYLREGVVPGAMEASGIPHEAASSAKA